MSEIEELKRQLAEQQAQMAALQTKLAAVQATAKLDGPGAIAQGAHSTALGAGAVQVLGDNGGIINLGLLIQIGAEPGASPDQLRRAYLARILIQANHLPLYVGDSVNDKIRLSSIYTALLTEGGELEADGEGRQFRGNKKLSALDRLDAESRLVLLGGPGSGKSTFVNYVSLALAGEVLGAAAPNNLASLTAPIAEDNKKNGKDGRRQYWRHGPLLPVRVILRDLTAFLPEAGGQAEADVIWRYLQDSLTKAALAPFIEVLRQDLIQGRALVLLDGLDEVPNAQQRRQQIRQAVEAFVASFGHCRYLVTSRTYAYQNQEWKLKGFAEAHLQVFSQSQIQRFAAAWYGQMVELLRLSRAVADERLEILTGAVARNPRIRELAERPLLLTLIAQLQTDGGGSLSEKREELYANAVDMLMLKWQQMKVVEHSDGRKETEPSLEEWLNVGRDALRRAVNRLAFEAHRDQPRDRQNPHATADIAQDKLVGALLRASARPEEVKPALLEHYLRDRAGLLTAHGVAMYQFPHRSFQEYLAACHLTDNDFPNQIAGLARSEPDRWREVLLLAGAKAARGSESNAWLLAETLCPKPLTASSASEALWGALLAGRLLVESANLREVEERDQAKQARIRDGQLLILQGQALPASERALAGRSLAALGDPRAEVMSLDGMQFCLVPGGWFVMGDDHDKDAKPQHKVALDQPYFIGRYPVSVGQWREYLRLSGGHGGPGAAARGNDPVTEVSWYQALDFCAFLTQAWRDRLPTGWVVTLPTEAQWEKAARGGETVPQHLVVVTAGQAASWLDAALEPPCSPDANPMPARHYPWGDDFDPERANVEQTIGEVSALGCYQTGASPYGCQDLAGNVWEWSRSLWGDYWREAKYRHPYLAEDGREDLTAGSDVLRVVRGGGWNDLQNYARCAYRNGARPDLRYNNLGFRVVLCVSPV